MPSRNLDAKKHQNGQQASTSQGRGLGRTLPPDPQKEPSLDLRLRASGPWGRNRPGLTSWPSKNHLRPADPCGLGLSSLPSLRVMLSLLLKIGFSHKKEKNGWNTSILQKQVVPPRRRDDLQTKDWTVVGVESNYLIRKTMIKIRACLKWQTWKPFQSCLSVSPLYTKRHFKFVCRHIRTNMHVCVYMLCIH